MQSFSMRIKNDSDQTARMHRLSFSWVNMADVRFSHVTANLLIERQHLFYCKLSEKDASHGDSIILSQTAYNENVAF